MLASQSDFDCCTRDCEFAAGKHATVQTLVAARRLGMIYTVTTMWRAVRCNTLPVLQFLRTQGCPWDQVIPEAAAEVGRFEVLRWLRENGCDWDNNRILREAVSSGSIQMVAWVKQQPGVVCDARVMTAAARHGYTAICKHLHAEQCPWSASACDTAALHGHVDTLRWLHEHGCPWKVVKMWESAAQGGCVDVMMYLQQELDGVVAAAAFLKHLLRITGAHNNLAAAVWLRQQGAEWPHVLWYRDLTLFAEFREWPDELVAWARAEGCTSPTGTQQ
jgi:hypothetical protein